MLSSTLSTPEIALARRERRMMREKSRKQAEFEENAELDTEEVSGEPCIYCQGALSFIEDDLAEGIVYEEGKTPALLWHSKYIPQAAPIDKPEEAEPRVAATIFDTFPGFPGLVARAEHGCGLCRAIRAALNNCEGLPVLTEAVPVRIELAWETNVRLPKLMEFDLDRAASLDDDRILSHLRIDLTGTSVQVSATDLQPTWQGVCAYLQVCAKEGTSVARYLNIRHRIPPSEPTSDTRIALMKSWIKECCTEHGADCRSITKGVSGSLPSMLISIGSSEKTDGIKLVYVDRIQEHPSKRKYVALSYCWGPEGNPLKATCANINQLTRQIDWQLIPKTVQDAIIVTRKLGYAYIWVDALCIIQDDEDSMTIELDKMDSVYGQAHLTLAAVGAQTATQGFLLKQDMNKESEELLEERSKRKRSRAFQVQFQSIRTRTIGGDLTFIEHNGANPPVMHDEYLADVEDSTWNTRGWTLQERHLSQRIVFFGHNSLHYLCGSMLSSELHTIKFTPTHWLPHFIPFESAATKYREALLQWYKIVSQFSSREFTHPSDRDVALDGLAHLYNTNIFAFFSTGPEHKGHSYMHGTWAHDIHRGLFWRAVKDSEKSVSLPPPRLPSWSWVGRDGPVAWPCLERIRESSEPSLRCFAVNTWYTDWSPLRAPLVTLSVEGRLNEFQNPGYDVHSSTGVFQLSHSGQNIAVIIFHDTDGMIRDARIWLLLLGEIAEGDQERVFGLALRQLIGDPKTDKLLDFHGYGRTEVFQRVGTFQAVSLGYERRPHETKQEANASQVGVPSIKDWLLTWPREIVHLL